MNRTDRLLAMVLELQGRGRRRAEDLARSFGVSKRTVYRDIEASRYFYIREFGFEEER